MEICKLLTISTAHVKEETFDALESETIDIVAYPVEWCGDLYGFFILALDYDDTSESIPEDLKACLDFAIGHDCTWLRIDGDGEELSELPVYDWDL